MDIAFGSKFQYNINLKNKVGQRGNSEVKEQICNRLKKELLNFTENSNGNALETSKSIGESFKYSPYKGIGSFVVPDSFDKSIKNDFVKHVDKEFTSGKEKLVTIKEYVKKEYAKKTYSKQSASRPDVKPEIPDSFIEGAF